jgi:hypothetical protein
MALVLIIILCRFDRRLNGHGNAISNNDEQHKVLKVPVMAYDNHLVSETIIS